MINKVVLKNFQSHKETEVDLSNGLNVLTGQSDSGKSAIIRAINWVVTNKPGGDSFRSKWVKKEPTEVILELDTGDVIRRVKGNTKNSYFLNDTEFKAMGQSVPDEIQKVLNIDSLNIQSQHDSVFLLSESSGEVARTLNRVVNLEIMDKALALCNSERLRINRELQNYSDEIDNRFEQLNEFNFLDKYEERIKELETLYERYDNRRTKYNEIVDILEEIDAIECDILDIKVPPDAVVSDLTMQFSELGACKVSKEQLKRIIDKIRYINREIEEFKIPDIKELETLVKEVEKRRSESEDLENLILKTQKIQKTYKILNKEIKELESELPKVCPLCGHKI